MIIYKDKIKAIIFDWGGVCCQEGEPFASLPLQNILQMSPEQISDCSHSIYNDYYTGKYSSETFWRKIMSFLNLTETAEINPAQLSQAYLNSYNLYPQILKAASRLKNNYQIGLLSNLTPEMRDKIIKKHQLNNIFSVQVYSCDSDVAALKPARKPYQIICRKLKVKPENCLFIDNSPKNIEVAKEMGMQVILFSDQKKFLKDIKILYE